MKPMRKWLFPALTCLLAAGAAILPPQVSKFRDLRLLVERFFDLLGLEAQEADSSGAGFVPGQTLSYTIKNSPIGYDVSCGPAVLSIALKFDQWYQGGMAAASP